MALFLLTYLALYKYSSFLHLHTNTREQLSLVAACSKCAHWSSRHTAVYWVHNVIISCWTVGSNGNEDVLVVQVSGDDHPESRSPDVDSEQCSVRVCHVKLDRKVVLKHLMTHVDDDRVHSFTRHVTSCHVTSRGANFYLHRFIVSLEGRKVPHFVVSSWTLLPYQPVSILLTCSLGGDHFKSDTGGTFSGIQRTMQKSTGFFGGI